MDGREVMEEVMGADQGLEEEGDLGREEAMERERVVLELARGQEAPVALMPTCSCSKYSSCRKQSCSCRRGKVREEQEEVVEAWEEEAGLEEEEDMQGPRIEDLEEDMPLPLVL